MKKFTVIIAVIFGLFVLASCGNSKKSPTGTTATAEVTTEPVAESESKKALTEFQKYMKDEGYLCGVAYLGYYSEDIGVIIEDLEHKGIYDKYEFLNEIKRKDFHSLEGSEFYAVVPAEGIEVSVNEYAFNENGIGYAVKRLANITDGTPVFIRGNISDIMPNIQIIITDENGSIGEYLPSMSLENGHLSKGQQIYDFSPYELLGGHSGNTVPSENTATDFIDSWWGEYTLNGEELSLVITFKENGEAEYGYGYGNGDILEYFKGSWYRKSDGTLNLIMYGGPCSTEGNEADTSEQYEFDGIFSWYINDNTGGLEITHESGSLLLYGTDGQRFIFAPME